VIEYPEFATRKRFANLDGLRFICILAVLWHHGPQAREYDQSSLLSHGFLGVDFFFVLSGFLITTLLLREQSSTGEISLVKFYWRRAIRIFPPYFLLVFTMAVLAMGVKGEWHYISVLPAYIVFSSNFIVDHIPNLDPTWSLAVEEQYYLLWPLLLAVLPRRFLVPFLVASIAFNVGVMWHDMAVGTITGFTTPNFHFKLPNATYAPILMGSLLAVTMNTPAGFARLATALSSPAASPLLLLLLLCTVALLPADLRGWPNLVVHVLMTLSLAALIVQERGPLSAVFQWPLIARVGSVSYGIYLFHLPAGALVRGAMKLMHWSNEVFYLLAYGVLSWVLAELSFRTLEAYFTQFRPTSKSET